MNATPRINSKFLKIRPKITNLNNTFEEPNKSNDDEVKNIETLQMNRENLDDFPLFQFNASVPEIIQNLS